MQQILQKNKMLDVISIGTCMIGQTTTAKHQKRQHKDQNKKPRHISKKNFQKTMSTCKNNIEEQPKIEQIVRDAKVLDIGEPERDSDQYGYPRFDDLFCASSGHQNLSSYSLSLVFVQKCPHKRKMLKMHRSVVIMLIHHNQMFN